MAEDANPKTTPEPKESISKPELAAIVRETKESREKEAKPAKIQIPANFTAALKALVDENKQQTSFLSKIYSKIEELAKNSQAKQEVTDAPKEDTTGQEAAAALKEEKPQPVIIKQIDPKALEELEKIFKTLSISAKGKSEATQAVTQTGGGDESSSIFSKVFGSKLLPLAGGLAGALALAVGSWFNDGPFKGLMKEFGKLGTNIFGKKLALEAAKLFPSLIKFIKPIARKLPVIGTIIDFGSAISRVKQGDFVGGIIDLASGIANLVPGVGTAISLGLGFLNAARDLTGQTEDAKKGGATKEGSIFSLLTQAVVKFAPKILSKLKFIPVLGSLFSFASAFTNFKSGNIFKGLLDVVAGVAGFFPGVGTVVSLLASGIGLVMDLFGGEKQSEKDPTAAVNVPKSTGGSLLSRLTKFLADKFKDIMKGTLNFLKKLPFVPDFIIDKVSNFLGLNEKSTDSNTPPAAAGAPPSVLPPAAPPPVPPPASSATPSASIPAEPEPAPVTPAAPVTSAAPVTPATPVTSAAPNVANEQSFTSQRRAARPNRVPPRPAPKPKEAIVPNGNIPINNNEQVAAPPAFVENQVKAEPTIKTSAEETETKESKNTRLEKVYKELLPEALGAASYQDLDQYYKFHDSLKEKYEDYKELNPSAAYKEFKSDKNINEKIKESSNYADELMRVSKSSDEYKEKMEEYWSKPAKEGEAYKELKGNKELFQQLLEASKKQNIDTLSKEERMDIGQKNTKLFTSIANYLNETAHKAVAADTRTYKDAYFKSQENLQSSINTGKTLAGAASLLIGATVAGAAISASKGSKRKGARFGGVFSGPDDGYDMTLHGTEAVIPLKPDTRSRLPLESPLSQLPGMPGSELVEKIETLIETIKNNISQSQSIDNSLVAGLNAITGGSNTTNVYQNSSERDIPYIERNKYRQKLIYSRGLI